MGGRRAWWELLGSLGALPWEVGSLQSLCSLAHPETPTTALCLHPALPGSKGLAPPPLSHRHTPSWHPSLRTGSLAFVSRPDAVHLSPWARPSGQPYGCSIVSARAGPVPSPTHKATSRALVSQGPDMSSRSTHCPRRPGTSSPQHPQTHEGKGREEGSVPTTLGDPWEGRAGPGLPADLGTPLVFLRQQL